jgi:hypothetical protein
MHYALLTSARKLWQIELALECFMKLNATILDTPKVVVQVAQLSEI